MYRARQNGINDAGRVVVGLSGSGDPPHAVLWRNGVIHKLGALPGGTGGNAQAINNSGIVVGLAEVRSGAGHAFRMRGEKMEDLGTLGGSDSIAWSVSGSGDVVGEADTNSHSRHAFLYRAGRMLDLGALGKEDSQAFAINGAGQVVGSSGSGDNQKAFLWQGGRMTDLNKLIS